MIKKKATKVETNFVESIKVWVQDTFNKTPSDATIMKKLIIPRCYVKEEILYFVEKREHI